MNDLLYLRLTSGEDGNQPVSWRRVSSVVTAAEELMSAINTALWDKYGVTRPDGQFERVEMRIAGHPRIGSIIIPFAVEIPTAVAFVFNVPGMQDGGDGHPLLDLLGALADAAALALFVREVAFGPRGIVARRTEQVAEQSDGSLQSRAVDEFAANDLDRFAPLIETLMAAAERTGCREVDLQINDSAAVRLVMDNRRRRPSLLARKPPWFQGGPLQGGERFDPNNPGTIRRNSGQSIRVVYQGAEYPAFRFEKHQTSMRQSFIVVWASASPAPSDGGVVEVKGHAIDKADLEVLEDVPHEFEDTVLVFLVQKSREEWR